MTRSARRHTVATSLVLFGLSATLAVAAPQTRPAPPRQQTPTKPSESIEVATLRKAAEGGDAEAQVKLADLYRTALDYAQAFAWYRKAAEQGNATGQYNLGSAYDSGKGVPQDYGQAVVWFRKAAEQGLPDAQHNLGNLYDDGQGVPQDYVEAHKWLNLAAARASGADQKQFADGRDDVAKRMTPDQLSEAQKRAREWMEAFERRKQ